jgi:hypothetical protein
MHLVADALEGPHQVDPGFRWKVIAIYVRGNPLSMEVIPRVPFPCLIEITSAYPSPSRGAEGLIDVELKSLRSIVFAGGVGVTEQLATFGVKPWDRVEYRQSG